MDLSQSSHGVSGQVTLGLQDVISRMKQLPDRINKNVIRGALRAGANVIAAEARARVPVRTGQLKASIRVSGRMLNGNPVVLVKVGSRYSVYAVGKKGRKTKQDYKTLSANGSVQYNAAYYAQWIEFGTSKMAARPFMRSAFESKKEEAVKVIADYIRQRIGAELAAMGAR